MTSGRIAQGPALMTSNPKRSAPERLFILRPDHLGDLILFSGALRLIRSRWPATHITLCVRSYGLELFSACPHIDRLFPYEQLRSASPINRIPQFPGNRHVRQALQECFGGWLRNHASPRFLSELACDLAVLPTRSPESEYHWLIRMIPASTRLSTSGNTGNQTSRADRTSKHLYSAQLDVSTLPSNYPELEMNRDFLRFMGLETKPADVWPDFWTREEDRQAAEKLFAGLGTTRRVLGITPGASAVGSKKMLPASWYADVMREMAGEESLDIVLLGSRQDLAICSELEDQLKRVGGDHRIVNRAGQTTILQLVESIRRCDAMLCIDAAPLHIATALRKPLVGIMGGMQYGRFFPWGDPALARVANNPMDCYGCNFACKYDTIRCVLEIPASKAARELSHLLRGIEAAQPVAAQ
jgi:ADP-heptose:LPS heptosyltransferase